MHLGDFKLKQLDEKLMGGTAHHNLRALGDLLDVDDEAANAVTGAIGFAGNLLLHRHDGLGPAEVHDHVALFKAPDDPVHDLALAVLVFVVHKIALSVPHALDDHLLGRLGRYPPKVGGIHLDTEAIADLRLQVEFPCHLDVDLRLRVLHLLDHHLELEQLDFTRLFVEARLNLPMGAVPLLRGGQHGRLERLDEDRLVYPLVLADLLDHSREFGKHTLTPFKPHAAAKCIPRSGSVSAARPRGLGERRVQARPLNACQRDPNHPLGGL